MKITLILLALVPLAAYAAQKRPDLKLRTKLPPKSEEALPEETRPSTDRSRQLEAKGPRQ
ncbi:MAG: hypothetical protein V4598_04020 [Bdellovibrionota bacterium]